jgi:hypothetical protein
MSLSTEAIVAIIALFIAVAQLFYTIWKYISKGELSIEPGERFLKVMGMYLLIKFFIARSTAALPLYTIESSPHTELLLEEGWRPQCSMSYYVPKDL